ncbi:Uma2 family endonuclease [Leptolyngbyaceae cyanobacterium UHCC 1019]
MVATPNPPIRRRPELIITWEKPPADFVLDDTPVENTGQPLIAGALRESLELAGRIQLENLIASNFGLCTKISGELTLKAPDWLYVPRVKQPGLPRQSYTPYIEGEIPSIVMEFLSATDGGEYSIRQIPPVGKWFFYEQVLKIPTYVIFEPDGGLLEVHRLEGDRYQLEQPDEEGRHWCEDLKLFLGTWRGEKEGRDGYWLRWWDEAGQLLLWGMELVEQERQKAEQERQRVDRLAELLRSQGIDPDAID